MSDVRRLDLGDHEEFRRIRGEGLDAHPVAFATDGDAWRRAPHEKIDALLSSDERPVLGLFDRELVGIVGLGFERRPAVRHKASLWGLYVTPRARGRGCATRLVESAVEEAAAIPRIELLRLVVDADNVAAIAVFERAGFERYGLEPHARRIGGTYHDQLFMCRFLRETAG